GTGDTGGSGTGDTGGSGTRDTGGSGTRDTGGSGTRPYEFMSLSSYAIKRPITTIATTLALVLVGAVSLSRLPVSLLPDVTLPILTVRTSYPGSAATEASRLVAEPIEE